MERQNDTVGKSEQGSGLTACAVPCQTLCPHTPATIGAPHSASPVPQQEFCRPRGMATAACSAVPMAQPAQLCHRDTPTRWAAPGSFHLLHWANWFKRDCWVTDYEAYRMAHLSLGIQLKVHPN